MRSTFSRTSRTLAAAVATAMLIAACGGSDDVEVVETPVEAPVEEPTDVEDDAAEDELGTIVDIAAGNDDFSTLVAAVVAAGLAETLSSEGPFTVFAPTDAAFAALPDGVLEALLLPENIDILISILTYHVVSGTVLAADVVDGDVTTVEGSALTLDTAAGVTVNGANVVAADIIASNGVIHVIDAVILPTS
jgi:uncharacterized surface protein with fasciclin (FAS1) repeats